MAAIVPFWHRRGDVDGDWASIKHDYRLFLTTQYSQDTVRSYWYNVSLYARWCSREGVSLTGADSQEVSRWFSWEAGRRNRATAVVRLMALRSFYRWLSAEGKRLGDPTAAISARRPKVQPRQPYTVDELRALLGGTKNDRMKALVLMFIGSGCRRREILDLHTDDIDWARWEIRVMGKGSRERRVAPGRRALTALRTYLSGRKGHVWLTDTGTPLTDVRAYKHLRRLGEEAGVVGATFHRFRVTAATSFMAQGMALDELQQVLGHSDIGTTAHYAGYTAATRALERQRSLADRVAG